MPWTTTSNASTGSVLTASAFNTQVLANLNALRGDYAAAKRTSGDVTLNSNVTWANVDTSLDLTLSAEAGDVIEYCISGLAVSAATELYFDVATIVSASPVNSFARATTPANPPTSYGFVGWLCPASALVPISGSVFYKTVAGDITGGTVVLRLRYATSSATNRVVNGTTASSLYVWARNHGPVEI